MTQSKSFLGRINQKKKTLKFKSNPITVGLAAMAGAALMIPVSAAVVGSSVHQDLSGQLAGLNSRLVQMQNTAGATEFPANVCVVPPAAAQAGLQGAQQVSPTTSIPPAGGRGAGPGVPGATTVNKTFVKKIVMGNLNARAINENTGPGSTNKIDISNRTTTTVTNTNKVNLSNNNYQESESGDATVSDNTKGGSATSGDAANTNKTDISILFKN